jgi:23S rRNA (adenine2503-C2)-methyltransferase
LPSSPVALGGGRVASAHAVREWVVARGLPRYRAEQILTWIYHRRATDVAAMTNVSRVVREQFAATFQLPRLDPERMARARDGTRKLLFRLPDGYAIESVLIPEPPRLTLCISSQAGCGMGCVFCATARLGLLRNLSADEIVGQVMAAERVLDPDEAISNVVFMGMGEPLHNYDAVVAAIETMSAPWGLNIPARRITVSTVGLLPQMERLVRETTVNLAVSLSATTEVQRARLMPINRKYPLSALLAQCRSLPLAHRRRIFFEYVMLAGINDTLADADRLVKLLHGIRAKLNLIPFNPFPGAAVGRSSDEVITAFRGRLIAAGVLAMVRRSRGQDIEAACGQLAARHANAA